MKNQHLPGKCALLFLLFLSIQYSASAQVTTATLSGIVKDSKGVGLVSATVTVEYPDAGIKQTLRLPLLVKSGYKATTRTSTKAINFFI